LKTTLKLKYTNCMLNESNPKYVTEVFMDDKTGIYMWFVTANNKTWIKDFRKYTVGDYVNLIADVDGYTLKRVKILA